MNKRIDSVIKNFFGEDQMSHLSIEQLCAAQLEAPYAAIFPLLQMLHPSLNNEEEKKWLKVNVHANNILWWQFVAFAMEDSEYKITDKVIENIQPVIVEKSETKQEEINIEPIVGEEPNEFSSNLSKVKETFDAPVEHNNVWVDLEPYHTIDYFASQGIKIDINVEPKDKLGKKLKSFTEWLKTMKRVGPASEHLLKDDEIEQEVVNNAAHSIAKDEIITETMAEVLEKQGKIYKAIEIYKHLSTLNPEKSSYFAEKIRQLKI